MMVCRRRGSDFDGRSRPRIVRRVMFALVRVAMIVSVRARRVIMRVIVIMSRRRCGRGLRGRDRLRIVWRVMMFTLVRVSVIVSMRAR